MVESCVSLWKRYKRGRIGDSIGGLENQVRCQKTGLTSLFELVPLLEISYFSMKVLQSIPGTMYFRCMFVFAEVWATHYFYLDVSFEQDSSGRTQLWKDIPID